MEYERYLTFRELVREIVELTGMTEDEAKRVVCRNVQSGVFPVVWRDKITGESGMVPPEAFGPKLN